MRKIYFRGRVINPTAYPEMEGEWFFGYYYQDLNNGVMKHYLFNCPMTFEIDPETLCQFTGFTDKNGNDVYEKDVLKSRRFTFVVEWVGLGFKLVNSTTNRPWSSSNFNSLEIIEQKTNILIP